MFPGCLYSEKGGFDVKQERVNGNGRRGDLAAVGAMLAVSLLAGCGAGNDVNPKTDGADSPAPEQKQEPVELVFFGGWTPEYFQDSVERFITEKYPHITLRFIQEKKGSMIEDVLGSGVVPDITMVATPEKLSYFRELGVVSDLEPLIKKHQFDLTRLRDGLTEHVKKYSGNDKLIGLQWYLNPGVLYVNKDIFDKFGVPHPKDGMTWQDAIELSKRVTRMEGGVQYRGLEYGRSVFISKNQLSLPIYDAAADKILVNSDKWTSFLSTIQSIYTVPGNKWGDAYNDFLTHRTLAMNATTSMNSILLGLDEKGSGFNWDVVTLPTFPELPNTGLQTTGVILGIAETSKHKDAAFQVISELFSDQSQSYGATLLRVPALKTEKVLEEYGKGKWWDYLKVKNYKAFLKQKDAAPAISSKYNEQLWPEMVAEVGAVMEGKKDINTGLRDAEDRIRKKLNEAKAK